MIGHPNILHEDPIILIMHCQFDLCANPRNKVAVVPFVDYTYIYEIITMKWIH